MRRMLVVLVFVIGLASPAAALPPDQGDVQSCVLTTRYRPTHDQALAACEAQTDAQVFQFFKSRRWTTFVTPA